MDDQNLNSINNEKGDLNQEPVMSENQSEFKTIDSGLDIQTLSETMKKEKKERKKGGFVKKSVTLVASAAVFGLVAGTAFEGVSYVSNKYINLDENSKTQISSTPIIKQTSSDGSQVDSNSTVAMVAENVLPSIVSISSTTTQTYNTFFQEYSEDVEGSGSGFIIGKDDSQLFIVTNYHVVEGTNELTVGFIDDTQVEATVKGYDSDADLAVVTVKLDALKEGTIDKIAMATIGDSNKIKAGDTAIAIGNALGYGQSVTVGCISATSREIEIENKTMTLIQTDAAINPGNSGGALLNSNGEVIGINTIKFIDSTVEGMGYSIPISDAIPIVENLISAETLSNNEQGYLGIQGNDVTEEYSVNFDMPIGVYIAIVADDSPAQTSGLCAGDIITKVNDLDIKGMERLQNVISSTKVGTEVTVTVQRKDSSGKYKEVQVKVTLGNRAESEKNK